MPEKTKACLPLVALGLFLLVRPAHAYIDPGTGSYAVQTLLGILFGLGYTMRIYWRQIASFFRSGSSRKARAGRLEE